MSDFDIDWAWMEEVGRLVPDREPDFIVEAPYHELLEFWVEENVMRARDSARKDSRSCYHLIEPEDEMSLIIYQAFHEETSTPHKKYFINEAYRRWKTNKEIEEVLLGGS